MKSKEYTYTSEIQFKIPKHLNEEQEASLLNDMLVAISYRFPTYEVLYGDIIRVEKETK